MRIVVDLGGNALLRRGTPLTSANQLASIEAACAALAPAGSEHELVITQATAHRSVCSPSRLRRTTTSAGIPSTCWTPRPKA